MGDETIKIGKDKKPIISEELCSGCGICVNKCPFNALKIINLPEALKSELVHQFGPNAFRLFRLPLPQKGRVIGLLGKNGIGKTNALRILAGELKPNLGNYQSPPDWNGILSHYKGTEIYNYLKRVAEHRIRASFKPQSITELESERKVKDLLESESERWAQFIKQLGLKEILDKPLNELAGGDLQRVAIAKTLLKDASIYLFDEPSSYLDIYQRLKIAKVIRKFAKEAPVVVVEHDLAVLDFLADQIHLIYGSAGAYGVVTHLYPQRHAINTYLSGWLKEENIRFAEPIEFVVHPSPIQPYKKPLISYSTFTKAYESFKLEVRGSTIHQGEVVGVVGPNAIGKTTFIETLVGITEPTEGKIELRAKVSYKPQYLKKDSKDSKCLVKELISDLQSEFLASEILHRLNINPLMERRVAELSGGELQSLAIALCLLREADIYMLDEPSSYLDSSQRLRVAKAISWLMKKRSKAALVVGHDVYFIDMIADSLMVFSGEPSRHGVGGGPYDLRKGMNLFLKAIGVTFRRDQESHRPRVNKPDSRLDREQRECGEYYYPR
jgi:ATP-binding cassette subfamily E protein 1